MPEDEEEEDLIVEETPEYSPKSEFNKALIVSEAVRKCMELRAKPMVPGYINTKQSSDGTISQSKEDDARQAYISAVIALKSLLAPEIRRDKKTKEFIEELYEDDEKLFDEYAYNDFDYQQGIDGKWRIIKNNKKFMPEIDEVLKTKTIKLDKSEPVTIKGYWNAYVNAYWDLRAELYDELFEELQCLIDRLNYFKPEIGW